MASTLLIADTLKRLGSKCSKIVTVIVKSVSLFAGSFILTTSLSTSSYGVYGSAPIL